MVQAKMIEELIKEKEKLARAALQQPQNYRDGSTIEAHRRDSSNQSSRQSAINEEQGRVIEEVVSLMRISKKFTSDLEKVRGIRDSLKQ